MARLWYSQFRSQPNRSEFHARPHAGQPRLHTLPGDAFREISPVCHLLLGMFDRSFRLAAVFRAPEQFGGPSSVPQETPGGNLP